MYWTFQTSRISFSQRRVDRRGPSLPSSSHFNAHEHRLASTRALASSGPSWRFSRAQRRIHHPSSFEELSHPAILVGVKSTAAVYRYALSASYLRRAGRRRGSSLALRAAAVRTLEHLFRRIGASVGAPPDVGAGESISVATFLACPRRDGRKSAPCLVASLFVSAVHVRCLSRRFSCTSRRARAFSRERSLLLSPLRNAPLYHRFRSQCTHFLLLRFNTE
ncbi:unnamed protein product [Peniophora sp. CBMAI 1063]|nr:unnamed protein product [Peniophora sp. CBMAI 1063]